MNSDIGILCFEGGRGSLTLALAAHEKAKQFDMGKSKEKPNKHKTHPRRDGVRKCASEIARKNIVCWLIW